MTALQIALVMVSLGLGVHTSAELNAEIGDRVVVWGSIKNCPQFPGVLRSHLVTEKGILDFFGLRIPVLGKSAVQIASKTEDLLVELSSGGDRKKLAVDILKTEQEYRIIRDDVLESYKLLLRCVPPREPRKQPDVKEIWKMLQWRITA